jgi:hypothetical protein
MNRCAAEIDKTPDSGRFGRPIDRFDGIQNDMDIAGNNMNHIFTTHKCGSQRLCIAGVCHTSIQSETRHAGKSSVPPHNRPYLHETAEVQYFHGTAADKAIRPENCD